MYLYVCFAFLFVTVTRADTGGSSQCTIHNSYIRVDGDCDTYIECQGSSPTEKLCPDGLYFNPNVEWPDHPCGYPNDIPCIGRTQPAKPTADCQHQYGFFPLPAANPNDCGQYRMCVEGRAFGMFCPTGLAFNPNNSRCDWPEHVASCNIDNFLGYKCPPSEVDKQGNHIVTNHKYEQSCYEFYSCINGKGRLLSCDPGYGFDAISARCVEASRVECDHYLINSNREKKTYFI